MRYLISIWKIRVKGKIYGKRNKDSSHIFYIYSIQWSWFSEKILRHFFPICRFWTEWSLDGFDEGHPGKRDILQHNSIKDFEEITRVKSTFSRIILPRIFKKIPGEKEHSPARFYQGFWRKYPGRTNILLHNLIKDFKLKYPGKRNILMHDFIKDFEESTRVKEEHSPASIWEIHSYERNCSYEHIRS